MIPLSLYVDNGACVTNDHGLLEEFFTALSKKYELSNRGELDWHLGIKFERTENGTVRISQGAYVDSVLNDSEWRIAIRRPRL